MAIIQMQMAYTDLVGLFFVVFSFNFGVAAGHRCGQLKSVTKIVQNKIKLFCVLIVLYVCVPHLLLAGC